VTRLEEKDGIILVNFRDNTLNDIADFNLTNVCRCGVSICSTPNTCNDTPKIFLDADDADLNNFTDGESLAQIVYGNFASSRQ
jgi:hypothetical protein